MKLLGFLLATTLLLLSIGLYVIFAPFGSSNETFVEIAPGTGTDQIAKEMQAAGVIRSRYAFDLLRLRKGGTLKAGEYRFQGALPLREVYGRLARGDVYTLTLVIPEGFNIFDIAAAVQSAGLGSRSAFLTAELTQTSLIRPWLLPGAKKPDSLEGFLFPDTYHFGRHASPEQMLTSMVRRFRQATVRIGLTTNVRSTLILASIIEKEVRVPSERPLVASVFENRLSKGMPLQTDPTVIYAALLENRYRGTIYASDLQSGSSYNTYRHAGLPPGPICSPGLASIEAAMHPERTNYLYFVSDAAGHSRFASDLEQHGRNVQAYRSASRP